MYKTGNSKNRIFFVLFLIPFFYQSIFSQIAIENVDAIQRVKKGVTYVVMKDTTSQKSKAFIAVFQKCWTFSKMEFIPQNDLKKYISAESSFFTLEVDDHTSSTDNGRGGYDVKNTHVYLKLWVCDVKQLEKWQKKEKEKIPEKMKTLIGRIELFPDFKTMNSPEKLADYTFDGEGHIRNWNPGFLKIYLLLLTNLLEKGVERDLNEEIADHDQLKNLKKQTLMIPDYILLESGPYEDKFPTKQDEKKLMASYQFPFQLIKSEDLDKKILEDIVPFFYLVYVKSSAQKYVSVYNSQTGALIYNEFSTVSYNMKPGDFEKLSESVKGK